MTATTPVKLTRYAWLSIAAAIVTMALKASAWLLTGSVGFLSDAAESVVNLVAAIVALVVLRLAAQPPDEKHQYGHEKAEYFAAGVEGALILLAAAAIAVTAIQRLRNPEPLTDVGIGIAVALVASAVNLAVALLLIRTGRTHRSITLEADGKHLMTDVWTSIGVVAGIAAVGLTGWDRLDPIIALAVAVNIVFTGFILLNRSTGGLMDRALPPEERAAVDEVLDHHREEGVVFHAIRTRQAGRRSFVSMHVLVPGAWTVQRGHDLLERVEADVRTALPHATVFTHLEPVEDPTSFADDGLDRRRASVPDQPEG